MTDELEKLKNREQVAAERLMRIARESMNDNTVVENVEGGYVQAQVCLAGLRGLTRILMHKGVISERDLMGSMAWAFEERASQLENMGSEIQVATAPIVVPS